MAAGHSILRCHANDTPTNHCNIDFTANANGLRRKGRDAERRSLGMPERELDQWAHWLLHRRHGGDPEQLQRALAFLDPVRDRVLDHAAPKPGETVLDVGCGDG
jgi:hypothetical protein